MDDLTRPSGQADQPGDRAAPEADNRLAWWSDNCRGTRVWGSWESWLDSDRHVDPYLVWADLTGYRDFAPADAGHADAGDGRLPFLIELTSAANRIVSQASNAHECRVADLFACMQIPGIYVDGIDMRVDRFFTARIRPEDLRQVLTHPDVRRLQLGLPRIGQTALAAPISILDHSVGPARTVIGLIDDGCPFAHAAFCDPEGRTRVHFLWDQDDRRPRDDGSGWLTAGHLGYGAELRHATLAAASHAAAAANNDEVAYRQVDYGPVRLEPEVHTTRFTLPSGQQLPVQIMRQAAHGAGAMFLAAGRDEGGTAPPPLRSQLAPTTTDPDAATDYATHWPIVFVQLPTRTVLDTSGGSLGVHVLDGIRYILHRASCLRTIQPPHDVPDNEAHAGSRNPAPATESLRVVHRSNRVVINVSYGAIAGPHDGTSIIEQAMAHIAAQRPRPWIVLAAGNAHASRTHARLRLRPGEAKSLVWQVRPDHPHASFLEIWLPHAEPGGASLRPRERRSFSITVRPPGGLPQQEVGIGTVWTLQTRAAPGKDAEIVAGAFFARTVAQGLLGTMVLLAVAPTRGHDPDGRPRITAPHGQWELVVNRSGATEGEARGATEVVVHAWAERNDIQYGNLRRQQGRVVSEEPVPAITEFMPDARRWFSLQQGRRWPVEHLPDEMQPSPSLGSLSGATTHDAPFHAKGQDLVGGIVAVGAYRISDEEVSPYSSSGPSRHDEPGAAPLGQALQAPETAEVYAGRSSARQMPDYDAPADLSPSVHGLRVSGMRSGSTARLSGTSAAAPTVARAIANAMHAVTFELPTPTEGDREALEIELRRRLRICKATEQSPQAWRATQTPLKDDTYRRGRWRLR